MVFALVFSTGRPIAFANPSGAQVVYGSAAINASGSSLDIVQESEQLILDWQSFSIDAGETTRFAQPSVNASVLNRVVSGNLSEINGSLEANGTVYLINPNGIVFGAGARIDAATFTASTLDVLNEDFLDGGPLTFGPTGIDGAEIVNYGRLEALTGDITLIAEVVRNHGEVYTANGTVSLAAGREVIVQPEQSRSVFISVPSENAFLENTGTLEAAQAEILAAHSNPYALAIQQTGVVRATGTENIDGEIWLVAEAGTAELEGLLEATNSDGSGGEILLTGSRVALQNGGTVLAEGESAHGGRVRIGGSRGGADEAIFHAERTFISEDAVISVDGSGVGNQAGTIIAWGNETLRSYGDLSARGYAGADGGFIETSASWFDLGDSVADVGSESGIGGEWLIDPYNIIINDNGVDDFGDTDSPFDDPTGDDAELDVDTIVAALAAGNGVTVTIETNGAGSQDGDITIAANMDYNGIGTGDTLWLKAHDSIFHNTTVEITDSSGGDDTLNLVYHTDSDDDGFGNVEFGANSVIETNGGEVIISGGNHTTLDDLRTLGFARRSAGNSQAVFIQNTDISTLDGDITIRGQGNGAISINMLGGGTIETTTGNITIFGDEQGPDDHGFELGNGTFIRSDGGDVSITGYGNSNNTGGVKNANGLNIRGQILLSGDSNLSITGIASQEVNDDSNYGVHIFNSAAIEVENGNMTITGTGGQGADGYGVRIAVDASIRSVGSGDIAITGTSGQSEGILTELDTAQSIGDASMTGDITLTASTTSGADAIVLDSDLTLETSGNIILQPGTAATTIGLGDASTGVFNLSSAELALIADGASSITIGSTTGTGAMDVESSTFTDNLTLRSLSGDIDIDGALSVGANDIVIETGGSVTQSAAITASTLTLDGSGGTFTLNDAGNDIDALVGSTGSIALTEQDGLALGAITVASVLDIVSTGSITQTDALSVAGSASFKTLSDSGAGITLGNTGNTFGSIGAQSRDDADAVNAAGAISITATGSFDVSGITTTGNVALNADGAVSQSGGISGAGLELLGASAAYTLTNTGNSITTLAVDSASLSFTDNSGFAIGSVNATNGITTTGTATLSSTGSVTQSQAISASTLTLNGSGGTYTLENAANDIDTLTGSTGTIAYSDSNDIAIDTLGASGTLDIQAQSVISNTGAITVTGAATFETLDDAGSAITLTNSGNSFGSVSARVRNAGDTSSSSANVSITATGATDIAGIETLGDVSLVADSTVTQSGAIAASSLNLAGSDGAYVLTDTGNDIDTLLGATGSIELFDTGGFAVGATTTTGSFDITSTGDITNTGTISVAGEAAFKTLSDASVSITLDNTDNAFGSLIALSRDASDLSLASGDIVITQTGGVDIASLGTLGNITLDFDSTVTQTGAIQGDELTLMGSGTYTLENEFNSINTLGDVSRGGAFSLYDRNGGLNISGVFSGTLTNDITIRTVGDLTLDSGASIITSGSGNDITLEANGGSFINNAGESVLTTDSRFLIYSQNNDSPHGKGGLAGEEVFGVNYGEDPQGEGSVFYYEEAAAVVEEPVSEEPVSEEPVADEPVSEEPFLESPAVDDVVTPETPTTPEPETSTEEGTEAMLPIEEDQTVMVDLTPELTRRAYEQDVEVSQVLPIQAPLDSDGSQERPETALVGGDVFSIQEDRFEIGVLIPPSAEDYYRKSLDIEVLYLQSGLEAD
ncbi:MAG: beta strand repeat-containing protein, partial [Opitutales bacterium]